MQKDREVAGSCASVVVASDNNSSKLSLFTSGSSGLARAPAAPHLEKSSPYPFCRFPPAFLQSSNGAIKCLF